MVVIRSFPFGCTTDHVDAVISTSSYRSSSPTPSAAAAVRERKRIESSTGSEIRVQHDAVTGLAQIESGEGLVDRTHREVLGLRRDIVP